MNYKLVIPVVTLFSSIVSCAQSVAVDKEHVIVFQEKERYAGWPANYGIWSWGDEIVTGFYLGYHDDNKTSGHPILKNVPQLIRQSRSVDGGKTWKIEKPSYLDANEKERVPEELPEAINFTDPNFAFLVRFEGAYKGYSHFYYSYDRCKTWKGPYKLPGFDRKGIFGRTDYIVNGKHDMHAFFTAAKDNGGEGWPLAARTTDGGKTWKFQGWIGPQPDDSSFSIMSSTVRLDNKSLLSVIRRKGMTANKERKLWLESFLSPDEGVTWYKLEEPTVNNGGNPPHMIRLKDGRLALTYGSREKPYGIRAKLSADEGQTWGKEFILRDDGNSWDLGYPRTVQRKDGKLITVYYINVAAAKERHIAATIWDPGVMTGE